ncbi:hypothetical protein BDF21DRAFT_408264 [Thamnidium elegans]|uniref:Uncharacterized protein n=1 Tax=Thamnidium elegans TaxID=101142 RepID=A0A8H7VYC0_9FUNG|nr:hypothetical protein INT48_002131 [Thamnidium elegans]KAI8094230.1 hypothetical protein BDF21DRAFT_408264 [Thamnidium elegans]
MSTGKRNSLDPYAGQYPLPRPLPNQEVSVDENLQQPFYVLDRSQRQSEPSQHTTRAQDVEPPYSSRHSFHPSESSSHNKQSSFHDASSHRQSLPDESKSSSAHISTGSNHTIPEYSRGHYYENNMQQTAATDDGYYDDPEAVNLRDYLYAERQKKLRKQEQEHYPDRYSQQPDLYNQRPDRYSQQPEPYIPQPDPYNQQPEPYIPQPDPYIQQQPERYNNQQPDPFRVDQLAYGPMDTQDDPYRHHHRPEPMYYGNAQPFRKSEELYPSPMQPPMFNQSHQRNSALFSPPPPPHTNFVPAPFGMIPNQSSNPSMMRPQPPPMGINNDMRRQGFCCFGISFCSAVSMTILTLLLFAGVGLIVATKILGDKCMVDEYKERNQIVCGEMLHNGFLYGGIVVAGLSGLVLIWKLVRWCGTTPRN